jgi:hypothetical protein
MYRGVGLLGVAAASLFFELRTLGATAFSLAVVFPALGAAAFSVVVVWLTLGSATPVCGSIVAVTGSVLESGYRRMVLQSIACWACSAATSAFAVAIF